jgi:predicted DNA-binding transcriptional regulator YafY
MPRSILHSRPPLERMIFIHESLQTGRFPNLARLAADLEVNLRTIKRDLGFMRDRLRLPIEFDRARGGYRYTEPVETFPTLAVTEAEIFALLVAHKAVSQYHGTPYERPLASAFRKLTGFLGRDAGFSLGNLEEALSFRPFAPDDVDLENFQVVVRALQERRELQFQYRKLSQRAFEPRRVHPYHLACVENHWYLFAHDLARDAMRTFALIRLRAPELGKSRFERPKDFDPDTYLRGSLVIFKGQQDFEVVVEFDAWAADLIRGRRWQATQEMTELPGSGLRLRLLLNNLEEVERWVLGWGRHATVIRPKTLARRVHQTAADLDRRYCELLDESAPHPRDPGPRPPASPRIQGL